MIDFGLHIDVWSVVLTLVLVLFYDVPIKNGLRWLRDKTRKPKAPKAN